MTRKHAHAGESAPVSDQGTAGLPIFARPNAVDRQRDAMRLKERLLPIVRDLASRRGIEGITASEVISEAITRGILPGPAPRTNPRRDAFMGPWLAQLARDRVLAPKLVQGFHVRRKSEREASHQNEGRVYVAPDYAA